jgi:hypothetical protein
MRKLLYSATALAFMAAPLHMAAPVYAEPVKMTSAQLDEITASGLKIGKYKKGVYKIRFRDANVAVNVINDATITNSVVQQLNVALQNIDLSGKNARLVVNISQDGKVSVKS